MYDKFNFNLTLSFTEIMDYSFKVVKKNIALIIKILIVFLLPSIILLIYAMNKSINFANVYRSVEIANLTAAESQKTATAFFSATSFILMLLFVNMIFKAVGVIMTKRIIYKENLDLVGLIIEPFKSLLPMLVTYFIGIIVIICGIGFFVLPGFILLIFLLYSPQIIFIDKKYFFYNIGRSFIFGARTFWGLMLIPTFIYALFITVSIILIVVFAQFNLNMIFIYVLMILLFIIFMLFRMFVQIAVTMKYINFKNIEEGPLFPKRKFDDEESEENNEDKAGTDSADKENEEKKDSTNNTGKKQQKKKSRDKKKK